MNRILFFPLRSNIGWFTNENTRLDLEKRIKNSLIIYDKIVFENGRYKLFATDKGIVDVNIPADDITWDRTNIYYFSKGDQYEFTATIPNTDKVIP
jgi:hypothetical protein